MNLHHEIQTAQAACDDALARVEQLTTPADDARARLADADNEALRLAQVADETQSTANRTGDRADLHGAYLARRDADRAADRAAQLATAARDANDALSKARSALSLAQSRVSRLEQRVNAGSRADDARARADNAAQAVETAHARIAALGQAIEHEQANLATAIERKDRAVTEGDRDSFLRSDFDAQVAARAIETAKVELGRIDLSALRKDALELRSRAERQELAARVEAFAASIDWNLMPADTVTLNLRDMSVRIK